MRIHENAFYILGVSPFDNKSRIYELFELTEDRQLLSDSDAFQKAKLSLLSQQKRISSELRWFPNTEVKKVNELIYYLETYRQYNDIAPIQYAQLSSVAKLTFLTEKIDGFNSDDEMEMLKYIIEADSIFEHINTDEVRMLLNADRRIAGFSLIESQEAIIDELNVLRYEIKDIIKTKFSALVLNRQTQVATEIAENYIDNNNYNNGAIIDDVLDSYEVCVKNLLTEYTISISDKIQKITELIGQYPNNNELIFSINDEADSLKWMIRSFDKYSQPLQLNARSKGVSHKESTGIWGEVLQLCVKLAKQIPLIDVAIKLIDMSREVFEELPELSANINKVYLLFKEIKDNSRV